MSNIRPAHFTLSEFASQFRYHQNILSDTARTEAISEALKKHVQAGTTVLDLGAGTGIWSVFAAKLGAEVVAVESEASLIPVMKETVRENGAADRVEVIHADANDLALDRRFDVVLAEVFGSSSFAPETIETIIKARRRYLAQSGVLVPSVLSMKAVLVRMDDKIGASFSHLGINTSFITSLGENFVNYPSVDVRRNLDQLSAPVTLAEIDLQTAESAPHFRFETVFRSSELSWGNAVAVYSSASYEDITLDNFYGTSWGIELYPFAASEEATELVFALYRENGQQFWKVGANDREPKTYSGIFAAMMLERKGSNFDVT
ncbi:MAG: class I SAM-dependent methyltransferase [Blastocatellia bacterium]|nr:class I SAM-dependent methyltransferase [Blastocatellia bacterium]